MNGLNPEDPDFSSPIDEQEVDSPEHDFSEKDLPPAPAEWLGFMDEQPYQDRNLEDIKKLSTREYLSHINSLVKEVMGHSDYREESIFRKGKSGYISNAAWKRLVDGGLLLSILGDRGKDNRQEEVMRLIRMLSYYSTGLGLTGGIAMGLGVLPILNFVKDPKKRDRMLQSIKDAKRIALAITPTNSSGTKALEMDSDYEIEGDKIYLYFDKHLQGNSGGYLIVSALLKGASKKTVGLFKVPPELFNKVSTEMEGLEEIRYDRNYTGKNSKGDKIRIELSVKDHLLAEIGPDLDPFRNIFIETRLLFSAMSLGQAERIMHEVGKIREGLEQIEGVQLALEKMKFWKLMIEAIFNSTANNVKLGEDNSGLLIEADAAKMSAAKLAVKMSLELPELHGGKSYYLDTFLKFFKDNWPFIIFEGSEKFILDEIAGQFLRGDRKTTPKVRRFSPSHDETFLEYFAHRTKDRILFNGGKKSNQFEVPPAFKYLKAETIEKLNKIKIKNPTAGVREHLGSIIAWLYALGNVDDLDLDDNQLDILKVYINGEIQKDVVDYHDAKAVLTLLEEKKAREEKAVESLLTVTFFNDAAQDPGDD